MRDVDAGAGIVDRAKTPLLRTYAARKGSSDFDDVSFSWVDVAAVRVQVFWGNLTCRAEFLEALSTLLDGRERARAARLVTPDLRRRFIAGRAFLRQNLSANLGISARDLRLTTNAHGKPMIADPRATVHFNLSHSGETVVLAIAEDCEVGIDIEVRRLIDPRVAHTILSPAERDGWQQLTALTRDTTSLQVWTRKEAVLKALGVGLRADPRRIDLGANDDNTFRTELDGRCALIRDLTCRDDLFGALAVRVA